LKALIDNAVIFIFMMRRSDEADAFINNTSRILPYIPIADVDDSSSEDDGRYSSLLRWH